MIDFWTINESLVWDNKTELTFRYTIGYDVDV
jgi:hypothetical protein